MKYSNEVVHGVFDRYQMVKQIGRPSKGPKRSGTWKYYDQTYGTLNALEGRQGVQTLFTVAASHDLLVSQGAPSAATLPPCGNASAWVAATNRAMFDLNPYQKTTGGTYYTAAQIPTADFIYLDWIDLTFNFANFENNACAMDVYMLQPKIAGYVDPAVEWDKGLLKTGMAPDNAAASGATNVIGVYVAPTEGYCTKELLGLKPDGLHSFKKNFHIIGKKSFDFAGDTNVMWNVKLKFNKLLDRAFLQRSSFQTTASESGYAVFKGLTVQFMYVLRGSVVSDSEILLSKNASIGAAQVGCCITREYHCSATSTNRLVTESAVPYMLTGGTLGQQTVENVVDAAVVLLQNA